MSSVWSVLSAIDCNEHIDKKGQFSYLAWTWAWAMVKERYGDAEYRIEEDLVYPDGTMEVRVSVKIDGLSHTMWLPVLDFKNKAIVSPGAFDINSARMRVLVKCLAMHGLGHYIYAGESAPQAPSYSEEQRKELLSLVANKDTFGLRKFYEEVGQDIMDALFNSAPDGTKTKFKGQVRELYGESSKAIKDGLAALEEAVSAEEISVDNITETFEEMERLEREYVIRGLDDVLKTKLQELDIQI